MTRAEFHELINLMLAALDRTPHERRQVTRCWLVASNIHWPVVARLAATAASRVNGVKPAEGPERPAEQRPVYCLRRSAA